MIRNYTWLLAVLVALAVAQAADRSLRKRNVFSIEEDRVSGANTKDFFHAEERGLKKKVISKTDELRFKKGFEHEDKYFETLKKKYKKTINVKNPKKNHKERYQDTIKAMKEGYDVIR